MRTYKRNLVIRICALSFVVFIAVFLGIFDAFFATEDVKTSMVFGFQCGLTSASGILALILIVRYKKALQSEEKLQLLFNNLIDHLTHH